MGRYTCTGKLLSADANRTLLGCCGKTCTDTVVHVSVLMLQGCS